MMFHIQNPNRPLPLQLELIGVDHHQEPIVRPGGMPFFQWFYCVKGPRGIYCKRTAFYHFSRAGASHLSGDSACLSGSFR